MLSVTNKPFSLCVDFLNVARLSVVVSSVLAPIMITDTGNTNSRERLSTVDLLIKVICFVK
jgi:hypothetical protein